MNIQVLQEITQFLATGLLFFYLTNLVLTYYSVKKNIDKNAFWHIGMCLASAVYCLSVFLGTNYWGEGVGDFLSSAAWTAGYTSAACYLGAIQNMFNIRSKIVQLTKYTMIFGALNHVATFFMLSFYGTDIEFMYIPTPEEARSLSQQLFNTSRRLSAYGSVLASFGVSVTIISAFVILRQIRRQSNDQWLQAGVIMSIFTSVNDALFGVSLIQFTIPLYMFGNSIEALRFTRLFQKMATDSALKFQREVLVQRQKIEQAKVSRFLLRMLSHDIANGLMQIQSGMTLFTHKVGSEKILDRSKKYIERGVSLIANTSMAARAYEKALLASDLILDPVKVSKVFAELTEIFSAAINEKSIQFDIVNADSSLEVLAEKNLLTNHVLANFLNNAIKFTDSGGSIQLRADVSAEFVQLSVVDNGVGMDPEVVKKIQEPEELVSTSGTNDEEGTGFGTSIAIQILERFGGELEIDSQQSGPRKGTRITITLRKAKAQESVA